jgi:hypothetical protein
MSQFELIKLINDNSTEIRYVYHLYISEILNVMKNMMKFLRKHMKKLKLIAKIKKVNR